MLKCKNYTYIFDFFILLVAASPPKSSTQIKKLADVKRIKVSPPKPGRLYPDLYPDLTCIESSSTETETEFTIETTEAETATLDEATETETGTEAEYYLRVNIIINIF